MKRQSPLFEQSVLGHSFTPGSPQSPLGWGGFWLGVVHSWSSASFAGALVVAGAAVVAVVAELDGEPPEGAAVVGAEAPPDVVAPLVAAVVAAVAAVVLPVVDLFFREVSFWADGRLMVCSSSLVYLDHIRIEKVG